MVVISDNPVCESCIEAIVEDMGCGEMEAGYLCMEMGEDLVDHKCDKYDDMPPLPCACTGHHGGV